MPDKTTDLDKIDKTISALIDQLDYLVSDIQLDKKIRESANKNKYDTNKDKIRSDSDVVWHLSNSITNLVSIKHALSIDKNPSLLDLGLGTTPKGDKK